MATTFKLKAIKQYGLDVYAIVNEHDAIVATYLCEQIARTRLIYLQRKIAPARLTNPPKPLISLPP